jgi:hypothetical protein
MPRVTPNKKKRKTKAELRKEAEAAAEKAKQRKQVAGTLVRAAAVCTAIGGVVVGYNALSAHVRTDITMTDATALGIVFADRPAWMGDDVARSISDRLRAQLDTASASQLDPTILQAAADVLTTDPWVRDVIQVRRVGDQLVIYCDWRTPSAIIRSSRGGHTRYHLVAAEQASDADRLHAVLLPLQYDFATIETITRGSNTSEPTTNGLRIITGIEAQPPAEAGQAWRDDAVAAGLDMAALLQGHPAAADVTTINVAAVARPGLRNVAAEAVEQSYGPSSPVVLGTRFEPSTEIYWGIPPRQHDYAVEPSPQQKLTQLARMREMFAGQATYPGFIDLRPDQPVHLR